MRLNAREVEAQSKDPIEIGEPTMTDGGWATGLPGNVHLLGAGGAGLSGAGLHLLDQGHVVTGQDLADSDFVDDLRSAGARVEVGPSRAASLPADCEVVVHSAAVPAEDEQLVEARRRGLPSMLYSSLLGRIARPASTCAVAGTHGKTTTSWMLWHALCGAARVRPGALIGGRHRGLERGALPPEPGGRVVLEACEYDRTFHNLRPFAGIITNIEPDHLDVYGTLAAVEEAFAEFVALLDPAGLLVTGEGIPDHVCEAAPCEVWRLGEELALDLGEADLGRARGRLCGPGFETPLELAVPGDFNALNAALGIALAVGLEGRDSGRARAAAEEVARFEGAGRRYEPWGHAPGVRVVHDYAHHPTEVRATLTAARASAPEEELVVLFQPHQASRTAHFLDGFVDALCAADRLVIADVYGARKQLDGHMAGAAELVAGVEARGTPARLGGPPSDASGVLLEELGRGDERPALVLVLGAGDIDTIRPELMASLQELRGG